MSTNHHYEFAEFGEALELDDAYRIIVYRAGDRVRYRFERRDPPIIVKRLGKTLDGTGEDNQTKGRPTT